MGGQTFYVVTNGESADEAFRHAVSQAQYDHGHAGYSGTIAEKREFRMATGVGVVPTSREALRLAEDILDVRAEFDDKWGPAGCIAIDGGRYLFFGWASC